MAEIELNAELCRQVVEGPMSDIFMSHRKSGEFGRSEGSLIIARLAIDDVGGLQTYFEDDQLTDGPDEAFYKKHVLYEKSWGENATGTDQINVQPTSFTRKALEKVFGAALHNKDYDCVLLNNPHDVARRGLIAYPGAVVRSVTPFESNVELPNIVVGYSGLWWWHDVMLSEVTAAYIKTELTKRSRS